MYRIDNALATGSLPAPGGVGPTVPGFFAPGVTTVDGDWLNAIQEELVHAITQSPSTPALGKTDRTQLRAAIIDYIANGQFGQLNINNLLWVRDETTQGTAATSLTGATQNIRKINTVKLNNISGALMGSNQVTLPAGTYVLSVSARYRAEPSVAQSILSLWDDSISSYVDHETDFSETDFTGSFHGEQRPGLNFPFTIPATRNMEIHHYVGSVSDTGQACNIAGFTETLD